MSDMVDPLSAAPEELFEFFRAADQLRAPHLSINPLSLERARTYSAAIQQLSVAEKLGLIVLDDADNSNPYCYIGRSLAAGMILHLMHDDDSRICFSSLGAFTNALHAARDAGMHIDELPVELIRPIENQDALVQLLIEAADAQDEMAEFAVCTFLPLLDPAQLSILQRLADHRNFFHREAVAEFLAQHPLSAYQELAQQLATDRYAQVARPAAAALQAIRRARYGSGA